MKDLSPVIDPVAIRILYEAMKKPVTVQEISERFDIPLASCYRKFKELIEKGLIKEADKVLVEGQKRRTRYVATINKLIIEVSSDGVNISWEEKTKPEEMLDLLKRFSQK